MTNRPAPSLAHRFLIECKMTCLGGESCGQCNCSVPADCLMRGHPDYRRYRAESIQRSMRLFNAQANDNMKT